MKRVLIGALAIASAVSGTAAFAGQKEDQAARLAAVEKENAALQRENAALAENKALREELADKGKSVSLADRMENFFGANAADLPVAYKAPPPRSPGILRFWGEGGAIWSGGDPVEDSFRLINLNGGVAGIMNLNPKIGWEGAAGFDYRFTDSLYHISGQFRYGRSRARQAHLRCGDRVSESGSPGGSLQPPLGRQFTLTAADSQADSYKETHWLADIAFGRDVAGFGPDAMQVKGGMRIQEFRNTIGVNTATSLAVNIGPPAIPVFGNTFAINTSSNFANAVNFLGAGPLIGVQGAVPFAGKFSFDYTGDMAVLFGTQTSHGTTVNTASIVPAFLNILTAGGNNANVNDTSRFSTMISGDIQAGFGYWVTPNVKLAASYRVDALVNVNNVSNSRNPGNLQFGSGPFNFTPTRFDPRSAPDPDGTVRSQLTVRGKSSEKPRHRPGLFADLSSVTGR